MEGNKRNESRFSGIHRKDARRTKFIKGYQINTMTFLVLLLDADTWIYIRDQPKHPSFIASMSYRCVRNLVRLGKLYEAIPRGDHGVR
jgi:hypothetical protein